MNIANFHSFVIISFISFVFIRCHPLSFFVTRCHSLLFVVTYCTTRFHPLSLVVSLVVICCTIRCHSLSLVVIRSHSMYHSSVFLYVLGKLPPGKISPSPNSNANPQPNPDPDRGAIFRTPFL